MTDRLPAYLSTRLSVFWRRVIWWLIRGYQLTFSAFLGRQCRFEPTCSHYVQQAVMRFGVVKGLIMGAKRVARCHPWGGQGFDPVPENGYMNAHAACGCPSSDPASGRFRPVRRRMKPSSTPSTKR